jgi:hypothetical protein
MPVGLGIALPLQTQGLVLKAPKKATLPEQWFTNQGVNMAQPA